jgi:hypothetical protein
MEQFFHLSSVGLLYDGAGVVALGFAFFLKTTKAMMVESGTYYDGNDALLESLIQQRTDGVAGTLLLMVGFLLQWFASLGAHSDQSGKILFIVLILISLAYVAFLRGKLMSLQVSRGKALRKQELKQP